MQSLQQLDAGSELLEEPVVLARELKGVAQPATDRSSSSRKPTTHGWTSST
jgi:hypothetical protein